MSTALIIRPATEDDVALIYELVLELAAYESLRHTVTATEDDIHALLYGPRAVAEAFIAEADGAPIGFALLYYTCSTFAGRTGAYLEDLYVSPAHRRRGAGRALLAAVARHALEQGCVRLDWMVLNWNAPAIAFYESLGARRVDEWTTLRLTGAPFITLADSHGRH